MLVVIYLLTWHQHSHAGILASISNTYTTVIYIQPGNTSLW